MTHFRTIVYCLALILGLSAASYAQADLDVEAFDKYGDISWEDEMARLDTFAISLQQDPRLIGYIVVYAGKVSCAGDTQRRGMRAKKYLVEQRGVPWNRVIWKDAGYLSEPYVILGSLIREAMPYTFSHPFPLSKNEVKIIDCKANKNRGRKQFKMQPAPNNSFNRTRN